MARGMLPNKAEAYQGFLVQSSNTLAEAAKALIMIARSRPTESSEVMASLEMHAYREILQGTIGALMALGHFPYLGNIDSEIVGEKLC